MTRFAAFLYSSTVAARRTLYSLHSIAHSVRPCFSSRLKINPLSCSADRGEGFGLYAGKVITTPCSLIKPGIAQAALRRSLNPLLSRPVHTLFSLFATRAVPAVVRV